MGRVVKVKFEVEFEVEGPEDEEVQEKDAENAVELAVFDFLTLTRNGQDVAEDVVVHVDGLGECKVRLPE